MPVPDLIEQLTHAETRQTALEGLVAAGEDAVAPLIATLLDEQSPVDWRRWPSGRGCRCKTLSVDELSDEEYDALPDDYESCAATDVAAAMSIDPERLSPDTAMVGHGVLALTKKGRKHGVPRGALPI